METIDITTPFPELSDVTDSGGSFGLDSESDIWNVSCPVESKLTITAEFVHKYIYSSFSGILCTIVMPVAIFLGCTLNGSFLYVMASVKSMQTVTNFYLTNLAVCDMLYLLSTSYEIRAYVISGTVTRNTLKDGHISCLILLFENLFYLASVAFVTLVTMERFFAICHPIKSLALNRRGCTIKLAVGAWVVTLLVAFLYTIQFIYLRGICVVWPDGESFAHLPKVVGRCNGSLIPKHFTIFPVIIRGCKTITFLVPFICCCYMCVRITAALGKRPIPSARTGAGSSGNAERVRHQVTRMLLINTSVFFFCNIPSGVLHVIRFSALVSGVSFVFEGTVTTIGHIAIICTLVNSAINPIIYNGSNPHYRQAFLYAFTARLRYERGGRSEQSSQPSTISQRRVAVSTVTTGDNSDK